MKLAPLLADYLYEHKKLELAGMGSFSLDPSARTHADSAHASEGISFEFDPLAETDDDFISFVSKNTGKMKALAASDLNSYLSLAKEFLNIGKPFQIEGIGTLVKNKAGKLEFTAGHILVDKLKESGMKELSATSISDEAITTYESLKPKVEKKTPFKKVVLGIIILVTTVIIVWAGYKMYKHNSDKEKTETTTEIIPEKKLPQKIQTDTSAHINEKTTSETVQPGNYRFVIETAGRERAIKRYNDLLSYGLPIHLSTSDSINFKLFFILPAVVTDTARIRDSLSILYPAANGHKAFVEN